jgi:hypothetical protein
MRERISLGVAWIIGTLSPSAKDRIIAIIVKRNPDSGLHTSFWLTVLMGSVPGRMVGGLAARHAPDWVLTSFGLTLTIVGVKMLAA